MTPASSNEQLFALLNSGVEEANRLGGHRARAQSIFQQVLAEDPANETAVLWLAYLATDAFKAAALLEGWVIRYPQNQYATAYLQQARKLCEEVEQLVLSSSYYTQSGSAYHQGARAVSSVPRLGEFLLQEKVLARVQLETVLLRYHEMQARGFNPRIGQVMVELGYLSSQQLSHWLDRQRGVNNFRFRD